MTIFITLWLISGAVGWWILVRYLKKECSAKNLCFDLPFYLIAGFVGLVLCCCALIAENPKTLKRWD